MVRLRQCLAAALDYVFRALATRRPAPQSPPCIEIRSVDECGSYPSQARLGLRHAMWRGAATSPVDGDLDAPLASMRHCSCLEQLLADAFRTRAAAQQQTVQSLPAAPRAK